MRIYLRPVTEKDGAHIVQWRNSEKVKNHCMTKASITEESNLLFYKEKVLTGKYKQFMVERVEEDTGLVAYPIATVYLKDIDYENKRCELCIFTSNDVEWDNEGKRLAIEMLLSKAFNEYGIHKVYSYVIFNVNESVELLKSAGFTIESIQKSEAAVNNEFVDVIRLCIFNPNK